jgi:hypothetical protein
VAFHHQQLEFLWVFSILLRRYGPKSKTAIEGDAVKAEDVLSATEQKYLPAFEAYCKKLESTLSTQGITILEQGLEDIGSVFLSGGNVTAAISTLIPQVVAQVKTDIAADEATVKADAKNAAYTAVGLALAALPTVTRAASSASGGSTAAPGTAPATTTQPSS